MYSVPGVKCVLEGMPPAIIFIEIVEVSRLLLAGCEKANLFSGGDLGDEHQRIKPVILSSRAQDSRHIKAWAQPRFSHYFCIFASHTVYTWRL